MKQLSKESCFFYFWKVTKNWVTIYTFSYPHEAYVITSRLESEGIECHLKDEFTVQVDNYYSNAINGVKLQVQEGDVALATSIMKEVGFKFNNEDVPSRFLINLIARTEKIPLLNQLVPFWRLFILVAVLVGIIVTIVVISQWKSTKDYLTQDVWYIDYINYNGEDVAGVSPEHQTQEELNSKNYEIAKANYMIGTIRFLSSGKLQFDFNNYEDFACNWDNKGTTVHISDVTDSPGFLNRDYHVTVDEYALYMESDSVRIQCHQNYFVMPF